ncbi:hypothetical protein [Streptomyces sp. NPDC056399]|uniref:hypothetical protein n=1 Tax=Streptomyces sp. NPDC056399 TaxID=3345807 RepID=UPI0035DDCAC8
MGPTVVRRPPQLLRPPHPTEIVSAGATGYLTRAVYPSGTEYRWTTYADGTTRYLTTPRTTFMGGQSDIVFSRKDGESIYWINDMTRTDNGSPYAMSHDNRYMLRGIVGDTLVMSYTDEDTGVLDVNLVRSPGDATTGGDVTSSPATPAWAACGPAPPAQR